MDIKLNLGCGSIRPDTWINTDSSINSLIQKVPGVGKIIARNFSTVSYNKSNCSYMNVNKKWAFKNDSVSVVYASHLLEHLHKRRARFFLGESYRVLKKGGVIRIVVPDLHRLARTYVENYHKAGAQAADDFLYCINLHKESQYSPQEHSLRKLMNLFQDYPHQHKYMYDKYTLKLMFEEHPFKDIRECSYGESVHLHELIKDVEYSKEGVPAIYLEAIK